MLNERSPRVEPCGTSSNTEGKKTKIRTKAD